jgi:hypothetical protein
VGLGPPSRLALLVILLVPGAVPADDAVVPEGFHEVAFSVSNLEGSARFYQEVAG